MISILILDLKRLSYLLIYFILFREVSAVSMVPVAVMALEQANHTDPAPHRLVTLLSFNIPSFVHPCLHKFVDSSAEIFKHRLHVKSQPQGLLIT